mmetsp:Transcript_23421/g.64988  ORF Transcript_23421/g.64988 Transcript_23421/m.64988 type:complete len:129 (-) Transcript_23421:2874-3260(-)
MKTSMQLVCFSSLLLQLSIFILMRQQIALEMVFPRMTIIREVYGTHLGKCNGEGWSIDSSKYNTQPLQRPENKSRTFALSSCHCYNLVASKSLGEPSSKKMCVVDTSRMCSLNLSRQVYCRSHPIGTF